MELNAIAKILQVGFSGLAFLLAHLAYNLIAREQKKPKPDTKILSASTRFMWFSLSLGALTGIAQLGEVGLKAWLSARQEAVAPPTDCKDGLTGRWKIDWQYKNCKADQSGCGDSTQHANYEMRLSQTGCAVSGKAYLEAQNNSGARTDLVFGSVRGPQVIFSVRVGNPSNTQFSWCDGYASEETLIAECVDLRPEGPVSWKMTAKKL